MSGKQILLSAASLSFFGLLIAGKIKLARAKPVGFILIVAALVFVASTPAQAE